MKFSEKLQKLRKENNLSQEGLADKLDVSRQSVSKWESGQTYPEMDKLLTMCKLFNVTLDDLTNDEVNFSEVKTKSKNTFDNLVDDVMYIIDKSFSMFSNMNPKERGKCIGELIILFIILLFFRLPFEYIIDIGNNVLYSLPRGSYILTSLWSFIINVVYLILFIFTFLYIYKSYFLDKYKEKTPEEIKDNNTNTKSENIKNENIEIKEEKIVTPKEHKEKKHKVHSFGTTLYEILGSICVFCFKGVLIFISIPFIISFITLFIVLLILLIILFKGVFYLGFVICIIASIILNWFLLKLIASFIFGYKPKFKLMFASFITGLSLMGIGIGLSIYEVTCTDMIYETPTTNFEYITKTYEYDPNLNIVIDNYPYEHVKYVEDETKNNTIEVQISYYKDLNYIENYERTINGYYKIEYWTEGRYQKKIIDLIIDNLKEKKIYDYSKLYTSEISIISSKNNIEKLKNNITEFHKTNETLRYDYELEQYQIEIDSLTNDKDDLINQINELNEKIENLQNENDTLKDKLNSYKENLENLLGE